MGFLDNSGDIILDAVLTDAGRFRMAKGDGSFKIKKFALGDDEINYGIYNKNHPSGSAYYGLQILQTPIFEAFTNNTATMNSRLMTIANPRLMYLPILKYNNVQADTADAPGLGGFLVGVDSNTEKSKDAATAKGFGGATGFIRGYSKDGNYIRIDQGLDTTDRSSVNVLVSTLVENDYLIQIDNRLGNIVSASPGGTGQAGTSATPSYIDDDNIASYFFSAIRGSQFVVDNGGTSNIINSLAQVLAGPRGTTVLFSIGASIGLTTNDYLFDQLGSTDAGGSWNPTSQTIKYLDSIVKVTGLSTGYRIDIPIRFVKTPT